MSHGQIQRPPYDIFYSRCNPMASQSAHESQLWNWRLVCSLRPGLLPLIWHSVVLEYVKKIFVLSGALINAQVQPRKMAWDTIWKHCLLRVWQKTYDSELIELGTLCLWYHQRFSYHGRKVQHLMPLSSHFLFSERLPHRRIHCGNIQCSLGFRCCSDFIRSSYTC